MYIICFENLRDLKKKFYVLHEMKSLSNTHEYFKIQNSNKCNMLYIFGFMVHVVEKWLKKGQFFTAG